MGADDSLPDDVITLKTMLRDERAARLAAEAEAQAADIADRRSSNSRLGSCGTSSSDSPQSAVALLDRGELQLAELEGNAAQPETAAQMATAEKITVASFERSNPARRPLLEHLPRERLVHPTPADVPMLRR
jgi:transposase